MKRNQELSRRDLLKYACVAGGAGLGPSRGIAASAPVPSFVQQVDHVRLYMQRYALFEEPDPGVRPGIYVDAATGLPTDELTLTPPLETFGFVRTGPNPTDYVTSSLGPVKQMPYVVDPFGFSEAPVPPETLGPIVAAIQAVLGGSIPASVIAANTKPLLVAIGHFEPTGNFKAHRAGATLTVTRDTKFEVMGRLGFLFEPPPGLPVPPVGILVGWLTRGLVDTLIGVPPDPSTQNDRIVYNFRGTMTLSTENRYIRAIAGEPTPVADPFPKGLEEIRFVGSQIDRAGRYTIVGHATHVPFDGPPEVNLFFFGTTATVDVEFAVQESGVLL